MKDKFKETTVMEENEQRKDRSEDQNGSSIIDALQRITDRSNIEVDRVYKIYRILAGAVTTMLVVGIGAICYVGYDSVREMRKDLREEMGVFRAKTGQEMTDFKQKTVEEFTLLKSHAKAEQELIVADVGKKVNSRIDLEFDKDNIQRLVSTKAVERIDKIADPLIAQHVEKRIDPKIKAAENSIENANREVAKTAASLKELKAVSDFSTVVVAAQSNDRSAFEQLRTWADDKNSPHQERAFQVFRKVMEDHNRLAFDVVDIPWREGVDPSKLPIRELTSLYNDAGVYKRSVIKYVWERKDIPKREKMQFLVNVIKEEKNLTFLEYAGRKFLQESKQQVFPIAYWEHLNWWDAHKDEIK